MDWGGGIGPAIADTIQQMGRTRAQGAAAKGQLIGRSLAEIGQFFANAPQRQAMQDERQARTLGLQALTEQRQQGIEDRKQDESGRQALMDVLADPKFYDPNTGEPDDGAIAMEVQKRGGVKAAQSYMASAQTRGALSTQMRAAAKAREDAALHAYDTASELIAGASDADGAHAALAQAVRLGLLKPDEAEQFGQTVDGWPDFNVGKAQLRAHSTQGRKDAEERGKAFNTPHVLGAGQALVLPGQDGQSAQTIAEGPAKEPPPPPNPTEAALAERAAKGDAGAQRALDILAARREKPSAPKPDYEWVTRGGQPMQIQKGTAQLGDVPYAPKATPAERPATGVQNKTLGFFNRAKQADEDLQKLEPAVAQMGLMGMERMKHAPNFAQTQTGQAYNQAQRAFTEARLRMDSGAAIPDSEFENDRRTYFAQPGDSAETLAQKARARAAVLASLAYEAGPALKGFYGEDADGMVQGYKGRSQVTQDAPPPGAKVRVWNPKTGRLE